jgi:hypothetical protein
MLGGSNSASAGCYEGGGEQNSKRKSRIAHEGHHLGCQNQHQGSEHHRPQCNKRMTPGRQFTTIRMAAQIMPNRD